MTTGARPHAPPRSSAWPWARRLPLTARPGCVAEARSCTLGFLADVPDSMVVADAVLLVSELVGNAVRHTGAPRWLLLIRAPGLLRIEVGDASPRPPLPRPPQGAEQEGGLGLFLLNRLALCWGWRPSGPGKVVWCDLRLPAP
ncbi:ATP-binding protein [Streptomyces rubellomurinus]|uniref:ATP-binding protein n=1 Tax=Streptomyces rubellomurinus (strain ATCC 31215) TaxID=359131 RepID=UPI0006970A71|nr:ATP-binding protein [Streptomyces rubellomurinus]